MGRRRYQQPSILKTTGKRPMWYFRARADVLKTQDGDKGIDRPEQRYYLGLCAGMTKQEAKQERDKILSEVINKPQVLIPSQVKFAEVLRIYRKDHLANLRETTRETQESGIRAHLEKGLGHLRMCDIDAMAIQRWLSAMGVAYKTKEGLLNLLRLVWNRAEDWGYTQQRFPRCRFSLGVRRAVKGHEMPSMDQVRRLLAALEDPYRAMAEIALYAGLRISEIRGLQWSDVTPETLVVRRRVSMHENVDVPKSNAVRVFDIRTLKGVLDRLPRESEWVFPREGGSYYNCLDKMQAARKAVGITTARFGFHHLRAVFNTLARSTGADAVDRQALMGHTTERMNSVYVMQSAADVTRRGDLMMAVQAAIMGDTTKGVM